MADEDLIITVDSLDEPFDTTEQPIRREDAPVRLKVPGRDEQGRKVARTPAGPTDEAVEDLRGQLTESQRREADATRRANEATVAARTAADEARTIVADSRVTALDSRIASATTESASLRTALKAAWDAGDFEKATELQEKMADVRATLLADKRDKERIEQEGPGVTRAAPHEGAVRQPQPQARTAPLTREESWQNLQGRTTPATFAWLSKHPECVDDPEKAAEAALVHQRAIKAGHTPDTAEYFRFAEEQMGYSKVTRSAPRQQDNGSNGARRVVESAPVDRGGSGGDGGGGGEPMRVELTRGELENATNGTIVWNRGPNVPAHLVGKPIGAKEMARRKALMRQEGRYDNPAVS